MKQKLLVICDADEKYLHNMQEYLIKKELPDFRILTFTNLEGAAEYQKNEQFEIFLVSENIYEEQVGNFSAGKIIILQENGLSGIQGYEQVAKYQSMERLISSVLESYARDEKCSSALRCGRNTTQLITFYSPNKQCGQTLTALAAGQILAQREKVLYLNFEAFSGLEGLLRTEFETDMSDFIYFVSNHSDRLIYKLEGMKRTVNGLDILPPANNFMDIMALTPKDWEELIQGLRFSSDYSYLILDMAEHCQGLLSILKQSSRIYTVCDKSPVAAAKLAEYKRFLTFHQEMQIMERTRFFQLFEGWRQSSYDTMALSMTGIGSYMREILQEDGFGEV